MCTFQLLCLFPRKREGTWASGLSLTITKSCAYNVFYFLFLFVGDKIQVEVEALVIQGPRLGTVISQVKKLEVSVLVLGQKKSSSLISWWVHKIPILHLKLIIDPKSELLMFVGLILFFFFPQIIRAAYLEAAALRTLWSIASTMQSA